MLPISIREKNCFFQQLKSARIKFIPKLCCVLRLFDKHIPFLGYANFIIHTEKTFLWKQKKKKKRIHPNSIWKKYVQKYSGYRWIKK